jgi:putative ABC transport system permease protein
MTRRCGPCDEEFREEIEAHVTLETDRLIADGLSPEDAASVARRKFGNVTRVRERFYESRRLMWLEHLQQDARFAFRSLRRSPAFMAMALLSLAIGLGANTAIFSVVNAVLLRPLAYADPDRLVLIEHPPLGGSPRWLTDAWRAHGHTLADFAGFEPSLPATVVIGNQPMQVNAAAVTPNFFPLLGLTPELGRTFSDADANPGAPAIAVLTHHVWVRRFGSSPEVLGKTIRLTDIANTGEPLVIVGILRHDFRFPVAESPEQVPLFARMQPDVIRLSDRNAWPQVLGRLAPGATPGTASSELTGIFKQEASAQYSASLIERTSVAATPLQDRLIGDTRHRLLLLMAAVGCVLLIVCANIASLLLARVSARQMEFAVRAALGARTGRLIRLVLTESLLLAGLGSVGALILAYVVNGVLRSTLTPRVSYVEQLPIDWSVLVFNAVLATAAGALTGLVSLVAIRRSGVPGANLGADRTVTGRTRLRRALLALEVAVAFVLVLTAALLSRTLWNLNHSKSGFDSDRVVTAGVMPGMSGTIPEIQHLASAFFDRVTEQIGRVPGVESVAAASSVPLSGSTISMSGVSIIGRPPVAGSGRSVSVAAVTPGYFATMRIRLTAGRDFSRLDVADRERVAIVNEAFVRVLASEPRLLGSQIQFGRSALTVIGIVGDTLDTSLRQPAHAFVYIPLAQTVGSQFAFARLTILARSRTGDLATLLPTMREAIWTLGQNIVIDEDTTMNERLAAAVRSERDSAVLFGLLAAIALLTAIAGVYGVVTYSVSQRTREMGVRIALGATSRQIVREVVRESAWPVAIGIATGLGGAIVAAHAVANILFGVEPTDPASYVATALALSLTALTAAWIPARHAACVDPVTALRVE